eukprot:4610832-Alexandrium_andersonii.AAC.1
MGSRVSPNKSLVFSTDAAARKHDRTRQWVNLGDVVPVACSARDLGAHLSLGAVLRAHTLRRRMMKAAAVVDHAATLPASRDN